MNFPNEFKDIVINYNNKNFNEALKLLNNLPKKKNLKNLKLNFMLQYIFLLENGSNLLLTTMK